MSATRLSFRHALIDADNPRHPHCKAAGDIDGDGHPDLLAASADGGGLYWYRYPDWTKHKIADGSFTTDMDVGDMDGDGNLDVVIPKQGGLMWYQNPRSHGGDPTTDPWREVPISAGETCMHDVTAVDLDGDGTLDLVTRHQSGFGHGMGDNVHIWKQHSPENWERVTFPCPHGEGLKVADVNGDGRPDVIIGGRWYENPGDILTGEWTEHLYMPEEHFDQSWTDGDVVVEAGDLTGNGLLDIVLSPAEGTGLLAWYEAPNWTEHILEPKHDHAHGLALGDMDGSGGLDIVVANMHQATSPQEVAVYRNQGHGRGWVKHVVATTGSHNIALADIGSTGTLDIYGANWNNRASTGGAIELWKNER